MLFFWEFFLLVLLWVNNVNNYIFTIPIFVNIIHGYFFLYHYKYPLVENNNASLMSVFFSIEYLLKNRLKVTIHSVERERKLEIVSSQTYVTLHYVPSILDSGEMRFAPCLFPRRPLLYIHADSRSSTFCLCMCVYSVLFEEHILQFGYQYYYHCLFEIRHVGLVIFSTKATVKWKIVKSHLPINLQRNT